MRKKILSIYLAVAIGFLSVVASAVPAYASNSTNWKDYFNIKYDSSVIDSPYTLEFKDSNSKQSYNNLSKDERRKVDYDAFSAISAKEQNYNYGDSILESTSLPELIKSIASASGAIMLDGGYSAGINAELKDRLTKISNSISASNRKFGGKGISRKASSTHPNNFGLGTLTLSKDFINDLRANVAKFDGFNIYPAMSKQLSYYVNFLGGFPFSSSATSNMNYYFNSIVSETNHLAVSYSNTDGFILWTCNYFNGYDFYFNGDNKLCYLSSDGKSRTSISYDGAYNLFVSNSIIDSSYSKQNFYKNQLLGFMGQSCIVFDSYNDLIRYRNYRNGSSVANYYISTEIVDNDYSTTVNKIYDYSSNDTYTTINNNITQAISDKGSGLTDEEYQKIVNDVMKQLQEEIDSKEDTDNSGNTGGGSGGDSGNTGGGESDTWLEKIFDRLGDVLEKIGTVTGIDTLVSLVQQIADDIKTLKEGGTLSADMTDTNDLLKDIKGLLGTLIAVQAAGDIANLLADTVGDKINDYADNLKSSVTEVADALQDVFPFSIPWDLMAILALFSAEPQVPVFDIPVNIPQLGVEHKIHVDLSDFESVSVICRAFLSISFAVGLMYLTIRITGGKDDD